jgi:hypothetical protein
MKHSLYLFSEPWLWLWHVLRDPERLAVAVALAGIVAMLAWQMPGHRAEMLAKQRIDWPNQRQP